MSQDKGSGTAGSGGTGGLGKTFAQLQAENMAERRFTDLMAAAGIGVHQMSQEVLYFLPRGFVDTYSELFHRAFGGKDDGGVGARGASQAEQGQLQMGHKAAKTNQKRFKRHWVIADEYAVMMKDLVDRRLRALAREIRLELDLSAEERAQIQNEKARCSECGRLLGAGWKFCPFDGGRVDGGQG